VNTPHTKFALGVPGFTAVDLSKEKLAIRMIDHEGKEVYATTVVWEPSSTVMTGVHG
jgi:hypothetical protein